MSVKSNYFKMDKDEFNQYLDKLKNSTNNIFILDNKFFYNQDLDSTNSILKFNEKFYKFNSLINSFTSFSKNQIIQSFLLNEIESTNSIENIYSTRHDIFSVISQASNSKDNKITSITNGYKYILSTNGNKVNSCKDLKELYDKVIKESISNNDLPDGKYFRKGNVYISNGLESIHTGLIGEDNINNAMDEFINIYNSNIDIFTKLILSHFIFEYVHPFYDGNGRLGRFLFSNKLYLETNSAFSFSISYCFKQEKSKYYKAFKQASDKYEFGCLNSYVKTIISILNNQIDLLINKLELILDKLKIYKSSLDLSKSEEKIYKLIYEASHLSNYGVSNQEIINQTNVSKRTLMYSLKKFKDSYDIIDTKIGKFTYHKFNI